MKKILITGTAGFIGFHLANFFLKKKWQVVGIDGVTDHYDVTLKIHRHKILSQNKNFHKFEFMLEDHKKLKDIFKSFNPTIVVHLAAQAGVRYSLQNPQSFLNSNIIGTFNVLEIVKETNLKHLLISSTSSVYGDSSNQPFKENENTDFPLSIYAATKKSCEIISHSYSYSYGIPITLIRFFTVYGPFGRPDMALFKFTQSIINDVPIEIFNHGQLKRDFTYIDDLIDGIYKLSKLPPTKNTNRNNIGNEIVEYAPYRIVNIGSSSPVELLEFIKLIEKTLGKKAKKKFIEHQLGDVKSTWSDLSLVNELTNFKAKTSIEEGIYNFVEWYREYYKD